MDYGKFLLAGVIWMLGWCMVLLAALVWFLPLIVALIGLFIIFGQHLFNTIPRALHLHGAVANWWEFIYPYAELDPPMGMTILYVLVPWIGVMAAGYGFGAIFKYDAKKIRNICLIIGPRSHLLKRPKARWQIC